MNLKEAVARRFSPTERLVRRAEALVLKTDLAAGRNLRARSGDIDLMFVERGHGNTAISVTRVQYMTKDLLETYHERRIDITHDDELRCARKVLDIERSRPVLVVKPKMFTMPFDADELRDFSRLLRQISFSSVTDREYIAFMGQRDAARRKMEARVLEEVRKYGYATVEDFENGVKRPDTVNLNP